MKKIRKMTRWGIGPKFAILTLLYATLIYLLQIVLPYLMFGPYHILGIIFMVIGSLLFIYPAVTIDKYFNNNKLRTTDFYSIVRHPIYASWILIIIPGIILYWGSILGITIPFISYLIFRKLIHVEDDYLLEKFGIEYTNYKNSVNAVFPRIFKCK